MKQPQDLLPNDEMSLTDLWQMLVSGWHLILGCVAVALVAAGIYLAITPSQFEATLVIKVGQVGVSQVGIRPFGIHQVGIGERAQQIESANDAISRMRSPGFVNAVMESLSWKDNDRENLVKYSYQVTSLADNYLNIKLYGLSPDDARRAVEACLAVLADSHRELAKQIVDARDRKFANLVADIADAKVFLRRIESLGKNISPNDRVRTVSWLQAVKDEKSRLRDLRMQESEMQESMKPELNTMTMAAEPVVVLSHPVYPKARRVWLFAAIGGLLLGVLLVSLRSIIRMNMKNRTPVSQR